MKDTNPRSPQPIVGVIPARYGSTRFPGKVLALLGNQTILRRVHDRASRCSQLDQVVIATDDDRILREVLAFGGIAVMTSPSHQSGTDRVAEAVGSIPGEFQLVVNVQADEPFVEPDDIDAVAMGLREDPDAVWTAVSPLIDPDAFRREDVVKAAVAQDGRVLYFSRAPIPHVHRGMGPTSYHRHHIGIYGYGVRTLQRIVALPVSPLESAESLEQLRVLEAGISIRAVTVGPRVGGIDTLEDLERAQQVLEQENHSGGGA